MGEIARLMPTQSVERLVQPYNAVSEGVIDYDVTLWIHRNTPRNPTSGAFFPRRRSLPARSALVAIPTPAPTICRSRRRVIPDWTVAPTQHSSLFATETRVLSRPDRARFSFAGRCDSPPQSAFPTGSMLAAAAGSPAPVWNRETRAIVPTATRLVGPSLSEGARRAPDLNDPPTPGFRP